MTTAMDHESLRVVPNLEGQTCFGCGTANPIGLHMRFQTDGQRLYSFVRPSETMAGWDRTVHGGILSTILDEIMGWTVIHLLGKIGVTRSMTVEFLKPVLVDSQLKAIGTILERQSDRVTLVRGEIRNEDNVLCAQATATFATMTTQAALRLGIMGEQYRERFEPLLRQHSD